MNKIFAPVWFCKSEFQLPSSNDFIKILTNEGFGSKLIYESEDDFIKKVEECNFTDISEMLLWHETDQYKIYNYKFINEDSKNLIKLFFYQINKNNTNNKKIILINPTETCSTNLIENIDTNKYIFVESHKWCGIGSFLYAKSMYDGLVAEDWDKTLKICNGDFKPFKLSFLVRRGHDRRFQFFKYLHKLNNSEFLLTYFNASLTAKGMNNEIDGLNFSEFDELKFPYCSHPAVQPVWFHASFLGGQFMMQAISLMSMSKFNLVVESCDHSGGSITEKSLFPFLTKTIPILVNGVEHIEWLKKLGFYTFVDELGINPKKEFEYSSNGDNTKYFEYHFDLLDRINKGELDSFYENNLDKIEHNYQNALKIQSADFLYK